MRGLFALARRDFHGSVSALARIQSYGKISCACEEGFLRERVVVSALSGKTLVAGANDLHQVMCH